MNQIQLKRKMFDFYKFQLLTPGYRSLQILSVHAFAWECLKLHARCLCDVILLWWANCSTEFCGRMHKFERPFSGVFTR